MWKALLFILVNAVLIQAITFNEIVYDPVGKDRGYEWVEIYSNETVNLQGWSFVENGKDHRLELINGSWDLLGYAVIVDNPDFFLGNFSKYNGTLFDSSFSLRNSGEYLALRDSEGMIKADINYSSGWGGTKGSLEKIDYFGLDTAENWGSSLNSSGTPGSQNTLYGSCDTLIDVVLEKDVWEQAKVRWKVKMEGVEDESNFAYWVESPTGEIVKKLVTKNVNASGNYGYFRKTFKEAGGYVIVANLTKVNCHDINVDNNIIRKAVIITARGVEAAENKESSLSIIDIAPSSIEFGDSIQVRMGLYRGNTGKFAVNVYVEDSSGKKVSEKSTIHLKQKYVSTIVRVPILLDDNCNKKSGKYKVVVEGFGLSDSKKVEISAINCNPEAGNVEKSKSVAYRVIEQEDSIEAGENLKISVEIKNDQKLREYKIWGYIYRGSKCYSCQNNTVARDVDVRVVRLDKEETKIIDLLMPSDGKMEGEYKIKIKINKDNQKTDKEITSVIKVKPVTEEIAKDGSVKDNLEVKSQKVNEKDESVTGRTEFNETGKTAAKFVANPYSSGVVVYQSNSAKAENLILPLLVITFLLLGIILIKN
jgi:hypothetical protein